MKLTLAHAMIREQMTWCANSREPVIIRYVCDLSTQHIINILMNVDHITPAVVDIFKTELEGRSNGTYNHVSDEDYT